MANGIADNMLVTTYLSAKEPVMVAPAMDLDMWLHPSTQRNVATLREDGVMIVERARRACQRPYRKGAHGGAGRNSRSC